MNAPGLDQLRAELAGELSDWAESQENGTTTQTCITPARAATWLFDHILLACTDHSGRWRAISYPELVFRTQTEGPKHEGTLRAALPDIMRCRRRHGHGPVRFGDATTTTAAEMLLRLWRDVKEHFAPRHREERILWDAISFALGRAPELVKADVSVREIRAE
jgi:hypothetical protein